MPARGFSGSGYVELMGLHFDKFFRTVVCGLPAVNTGECNGTLRHTIGFVSKCKLQTTKVAVNSEIPLSGNPLQHRLVVSFTRRPNHRVFFATVPMGYLRCFLGRPGFRFFTRARSLGSMK